jgi:hypothetical protein
MTERYPQVHFDWIVEDERFPCTRTSLSICFYARHPHRELGAAVLEALETYRRAIAPHSLAWNPGLQGYWEELDDTRWESHRQELLDPRGANIRLSESPELTTNYKFRYRGWPLDDSPYNREEGHTCAVGFWLPTEYLEEHGPAQVRKLALELGSKLPFNSGHAGLSFYFSESLYGAARMVRELCFRYPGMDMPEMESLDMHLGTRVKGVSWLTFLGAPVLDQLGGTTGLRSRLHSAGTSVEEMSAGRAIVTLGEWPEAGDLEKGRILPAYRELARVLEPWLYHAPRSPWSGFTIEDVRRWERRFLE